MQGRLLGLFVQRIKYRFFRSVNHEAFVLYLMYDTKLKRTFKARPGKVASSRTAEDRRGHSKKVKQSDSIKVQTSFKLTA